jgi:nucleotide-binding universal stress UspA family protein
MNAHIGDRLFLEGTHHAERDLERGRTARRIGRARCSGHLPGPERPARSGAADETRQAALLVLNDRGHGGVAGPLLGSVSQHLIHHAACPAVVDRPNRNGAS